MAVMNFAIADLEAMLAESRKRLPGATHVNFSSCHEYKGGERGAPVVHVFSLTGPDGAGGLFTKAIPVRINASPWEEGGYYGDRFVQER